MSCCLVWAVSSCSTSLQAGKCLFSYFIQDKTKVKTSPHYSWYGYSGFHWKWDEVEWRVAGVTSPPHKTAPDWMLNILWFKMFLGQSSTRAFFAYFFWWMSPASNSHPSPNLQTLPTRLCLPGPSASLQGRAKAVILALKSPRAFSILT